jgi:hypothetical protein
VHRTLHPPESEYEKAVLTLEPSTIIYDSLGGYPNEDAWESAATSESSSLGSSE